MATLQRSLCETLISKRAQFRFRGFRRTNPHFRPLPHLNNPCGRLFVTMPAAAADVLDVPFAKVSAFLADRRLLANDWRARLAALKHALDTMAAPPEP